MIKHFLILALTCGLLIGCASSNKTSFKEQYEQLEQEDKEEELNYYKYKKDARINKDLMSEGDRFATTQIEAQKERRAVKPVVESNYLFEIYPDNTNVYSYDEYDQVWTDAPKLKDYKTTKRLWKKPTRSKPVEESYSAEPVGDDVSYE